jgi:enediyne biosynthesis protein E8
MNDNVPESLAVSRRRLLQLATAAFAAWQAAPWADTVTALAGNPAGSTSDAMTATLEAFADTLIPGHKRYDGDHAVAGAARGPGAVHAGALDLMWFPEAAIGPALPMLATMLDARAVAYAGQHQRMLDPTLPPFVGLPFADRTRLLVGLLDPASQDYLVWWALAAMPFLAFHTAAHLNTVRAVRHGHPGLRWIGFPSPDRDGLWRFPHFSYRRKLARSHPHTTRTGNPP